jgi:polyketide biosynthesis enoyl-CoA hydratase PksH
MNYEAIKVTISDGVCRIILSRPEHGNAINSCMIDEISETLKRCENASVDNDKPVLAVVFEGNEKVFSTGGDFEAVSENGSAGDPAPLYDLWLRMSNGPFVTISVVKGRTNAGGVGFVAASDIVIAGEEASFSLSEMLFGLYPACVLPFLVRRIGRQHAHYMTLMTKHVSPADAQASGLVDVVAGDPNAVLEQHIKRLKYLKPGSIADYKNYMSTCKGDPIEDRVNALSANRKMFSDPDVISGIQRYVSELKLPWEN